MAMLLVACQQTSAPVPNGAGNNQTELNPEDSAKVLFEKVDHYYKNVVHDSLAAIVPDAKAYFEQHGNWREYYTIWCLYVNDLVWGGKIEQGLNEAKQMHADAISRKSDFGVMEAYTAMGIAYHYLGNDDESSRCYDEALRLYPKDADQSVKQNIYSYYSQVLLDNKAYQQADTVFKEWYSHLQTLTAQDPENPRFTHARFRFHREYYKLQYALNRYQQAEQELDSMVHWLAKEDDRKLYEAQVARLRAQLSTAKGNMAEAERYSDQALRLAAELDHNTQLYAMKQRAEMLRHFGRYKESLEAHLAYEHIEDSLIKADNKQQLNELNKRFEVDELKAQQERAAFENERKLLINFLTCATIVVIVLVLLILFRHRSGKRLREAHALLEKRNEELQQSYEQLKIANKRAEESSLMKADFVRQISHEIRTPLNVLSGFTQVITTPGMELDDEEKIDISHRITENTNRITSLVGKMLDLAEASSQTVIERSDHTSAAEAASKAVEESGISEAHHITFLQQLPPDADAIRFDTNLRYASRALSSLLENAQKFTKEGSVTLSIAHNAKNIDFIVEDTGIGIPADEAERIFEEFVQLDEYYDGTGIGLSVARSIARRLGGDVRLDTSYTAGARFLLTLPLERMDKHHSMFG